MTKTCFVCNSENITNLNVGDNTFYKCNFCSHIFHIREKTINYSNKSGRNAFNSMLESKMLSRYNDIKKLIKDKKNIIEIGCAEGILAEKIKADFEVYFTGIEPSKDSEIAIKRVDEIYVGDFEGYKSNRKYDVVLSYHVLEHIEKLQNFMKKVDDVISEEAIVVLEVPNGISGSTIIPVDYNPEHINFFSVRSLVYLLENFGYKVIELTTENKESFSYDDCIRVVAKKDIEMQFKIEKYKQLIKVLFGEKFSIYGAGGYFYDLLYPYLDEGQISYIFDKDTSKHGKLVYGVAVMNPDSIAEVDYDSIGNMLISSLDYYDEIKDYLVNNHNFPENSIKDIRDLLIKDL